MGFVSGRAGWRRYRMAGTRPMSRALATNTNVREWRARDCLVPTRISDLSGDYNGPLHVSEYGKRRSRRDVCRQSLLGCADSQREKAKSCGLALPALPERFGGAAEGNSRPIDGANRRDLHRQCPRIPTRAATSDVRDGALHRRSFFNENMAEL